MQKKARMLSHTRFEMQFAADYQDALRTPGI